MIYDGTLGLLWYLTLTVFGLAALPVSMRVFYRMPDKGIVLARPLGWLLVGFTAWVLAFIGLPFTRMGLVLVIALIAGLSGWVVRSRKAWVIRQWKKGWRTALNGEILTLAVYALVLFIRRGNPNIDHTEKPMDLTFLSGLINAVKMPPPDPWLAGGTINYHYGGYLLHSIPAKLLGVLPEYAYNLSIAAVAAMAAACAFSLGRALFGRCRWGALSVAAVLFAGNLALAAVSIDRDHAPQSVYEWRFQLLWNSSRVIYDGPRTPENQTINESPFFSTMWADLHPHFSDIPFFLLFLCIAYNLYLALCRLSAKRFYDMEWPLLTAGVISCAYLMPTNLFDFPIASALYGALICAGLLYVYFARKRSVKDTLMLATSIALPVMALAAATPFRLYFKSPITKNVLIAAPHQSGLFDFCLVFGVPLALSLIYLAARIGPLFANRSKEETGFIASSVGILFVLLWTATGHIVASLTPMLALLFFGVAAMTLLVKQGPMKIAGEAGRKEAFCLIAVGLAWSLAAACEYICLNDGYGSKRLNTLFKFHFPAWLIFGVALPPMMVWAVRRARSISTRAAIAVPSLLLAAATFFGPLYTLYAFWGISEQRLITLDGLAYMKTYQPNEFRLIEWIRENAPRDAVLMEIPGAAYTLDSRISASTGRPSVIGWEGHERLWRGDHALIDERRNDVLSALTTQNWDAAKRVLDKYNVSYIALVRPNNEAYQRMIPQFLLGEYRRHTEPVLQAAGPYELFKVKRGKADS
ncbi:MAG: hypothetical protein GC154_06495 [bacterium]|nr:hypothetical protein [bacterium]